MNTSFLRISGCTESVNRIITPQSGGGIPLPPDSGFTLDRHPYFEILIDLKGTCDFPLSGNQFRLTPGTAVLIPPWTQHSYGYRSCDTGLMHLWIHLRTVYYGTTLSIECGNWTIRPEFSFSVSPELYSFFQTRWSAWKQKGEAGQEDLFFKNVLNSFLDEMLLNGRKTRNHERNVVSETVALIRHANGRGCTLDWLARQVKCSKYHLAHMVKKAAGKPVGSIIEETRVAYVHSALEQGLSQKEIAGNLGFSSAASFWNWYHRWKQKS